MADEASVASGVRSTIEQLGRVDILVNNAGIGTYDRVTIERVRYDEWRRLLAVDLDGLFLVSRQVIPHMTGAVLAVDGGWTAGYLRDW